MSGEGRSAARSLCAALDRADALGLHEHAERLATTAARVSSGHAGLTERLARWRFRRGQPEIALAILDGCRHPPASLRLLRAACLVRLGRRFDAQLDLRRWSGRSSAPLDARLLLALLEWEQGDLDAAAEALLRNLRHLEHPPTLQALALLALERGQRDQARSWAMRLTLASTSDEARRFLQTLRLADSPIDAAPSERRVESLAAELVLFEPLIPTLVEAQARHLQPANVALLSAAVERAMPDLGDRAAGAASIARLALLRGDLDAARTWATRGLAMNSLSAPLSLLLHEIESRAARLQSPAAGVEPADRARRRSRAA